jgi:hypothetical protein
MTAIRCPSAQLDDLGTHSAVDAGPATCSENRSSEFVDRSSEIVFRISDFVIRNANSCISQFVVRSNVFRISYFVHGTSYFTVRNSDYCISFLVFLAPCLEYVFGIM